MGFSVCHGPINFADLFKFFVDSFKKFLPRCGVTGFVGHTIGSTPLFRRGLGGCQSGIFGFRMRYSFWMSFGVTLGVGPWDFKSSPVIIGFWLKKTVVLLNLVYSIGMESSGKSVISELEGLDPDSYGGAAGFVEGERVKGGFWYLGENPTVDMVVMKDRRVLLIKRGVGGAESGKWALPGGFIDSQASRGQEWVPGRETPRQAALRELNEETNLKLFGRLKNLSSRLVEVGVFEGGGRDPRDSEVAWSRSHAFAVRLLDSDSVNFSQIQGMDDALEARWVGLDELPPMAFDHERILSEALVRLSEFEKSQEPGVCL